MSVSSHLNFPELEISHIDQPIKGEPLSVGVYSRVVSDPDVDVVIKYMRRPLMTTLYNELAVALNLAHPSLVPVNKIHLFSHKYVKHDFHLQYELVMPKCTPITGNWLRETSWERRRTLVHQLLDGLIFLEDNGVIHGDIKLDNLMLYEGHLVLIDFGLIIRDWWDHQVETQTYSDMAGMTYQGMDVIKPDPNYDQIANTMFALGITIILLMSPEKYTKYNFAHLQPIEDDLESFLRIFVPERDGLRLLVRYLIGPERPSSFRHLLNLTFFDGMVLRPGQVRDKMPLPEASVPLGKLADYRDAFNVIYGNCAGSNFRLSTIELAFNYFVYYNMHPEMLRYAQLHIVYASIIMAHGMNNDYQVTINQKVIRCDVGDFLGILGALKILVSLTLCQNIIPSRLSEWGGKSCATMIYGLGRPQSWLGDPHQECPGSQMQALDNYTWLEPLVKTLGLDLESNSCFVVWYNKDETKMIDLKIEPILNQVWEADHGDIFTDIGENST